MLSQPVPILYPEATFNDDVVLGYVLEKTHLRKFILRLITIYHNRLIDLEEML